ncbi:hypothetical protein HPB50_010263 [Hyalomma asiaticum]|uniref:Uncharacterized protein n=1 Tax=Hyalomma asiaticum TaxID=266040 RepID=A0ACB7SFY2_HYAAI|nr:hypothetical protein HPB50_010263 [Hyalomma asiaticum]
MTRRRTRTPSRNGPLTNDAPSTAADISPAASGGRAAASRRFASSTPGGGTRRTPPPPPCPRQLLHVLFFYSDAARSLAFLTITRASYRPIGWMRQRRRWEKKGAPSFNPSVPEIRKLEFTQPQKRFHQSLGRSCSRVSGACERTEATLQKCALQK